MPITRNQVVTEQRQGDEAAPTPLQRAIEALQLLTAESHINAALEAWAEVENQYQRDSEGQRRNSQPARPSFQLWALERFQRPFISRVEQWKHEAHFHALTDDKQGLLRNVAKVFGTDIWVVYFVLGESIAVSQKGLKIVLRIKKTCKDLSLARLLTTMETQREQRQGHRIPQLARQDPSKFSLYDMKQTRSMLLPTLPPLPPSPRVALTQNTPPVEVPMTPAPSTLPSLLPIVQEISAGAIMKLQTPHSDGRVSAGAKTEYEDSDGDVQVEYGRRQNAPRLSDVSALNNSTLNLEGCEPERGPDDDEYGNGRLLDSHAKPPDLRGDHATAYPFVNPEGYEIEDNGPDVYDDGSDSDDIDDAEERENDDGLRCVDNDVDEDRDPDQTGNSHQSKWGLQGQLLRYKTVAVLDERHLFELQVGQQLSDEVINYYIQSLLDTSSSSLWNQIFTRSSFFYEKMQRGYRDEIDYASVSRWSNGVDCVRLQDAKYLMLPIAADGHWFLVIAGNLTAGHNLLEHQPHRRGPLVFVTVIDSLGARISSLPSRIRVAEDVRDYICLEAKVKLNLQLSHDDFWMRLPQHVLKQPNGKDCGIYVLEHARQFLNESSQFLDNMFRRGFEPFDAVSMRRDIEQSILYDKTVQDYDTRLNMRQVGNRQGKQQDKSETIYKRPVHAIEEAERLQNIDAGSIVVKHSQVHVVNTNQVCHASLGLVPKINSEKPNQVGDAPLNRGQMSEINKSLQHENVRFPKQINGDDKASFDNETTSTNIVWSTSKRVRSPSPNHIAQRKPKKTRLSTSNMKAISAQTIIDLIIREKHLNIDLELDGVTREDLVEKGVWNFAQTAVINIDTATYEGLYPKPVSTHALKPPENSDPDVRQAQLSLLNAKLSRAERGIMSAQLLRTAVESSITGTRKAQLLFSGEAELIERRVDSSALLKGAIRATRDAVELLAQTLESLLTETEKLVMSLRGTVTLLEESLRDVEGEKSS